MKVLSLSWSAWIIGVVLSIMILLLLISLLATATGLTVYWYTASDGLPSDIQALTTASTTLYAGAWGEGVYRSTGHGATWHPVNTGITLPLHIQGGLAVNTGLTR